MGSLLRTLLATPLPDDGPWRDGTPSGVVAWIERCEEDPGGALVPTMKALREGLHGAWGTAPIRVQNTPRPSAAQTTPSALPPSPSEMLPEAPVSAPIAAQQEDPQGPREAGGSTVLFTSLSSAADDEGDEFDRTRRAPPTSERGRLPPAPLPRAPAPPAERGENTVMLTSLSSTTDDDESDMTRRADPRSLRALLGNSVPQSPHVEPEERRDATVMLSTLSSTPQATEEEVEMTHRAPASSRHQHRPPEVPGEPDDHTVRVANFPPDLNPWQTPDGGALAPIVPIDRPHAMPVAPQRVVAPVLSTTPPTRSRGVLAAVLLGVVVLATFLAWMLAR